MTYDGAIKLFDFGLAKVKGRRHHTQSGVVKGKVPYLSPEQLLQLPLDRRSDMFSLGTTLWELTTMTRLFKRATDLGTIFAIRDGVVPDPTLTAPHYPPALWTIVARALAANRDERYATAVELADELEAFALGHGDGGLSTMVGTFLDRLFPGERSKQTAWLARAATLPAKANAVTMVPPAPIVSLAEAPIPKADASTPLLLVHKKH